MCVEGRRPGTTLSLPLLPADLGSGEKYKESVAVGEVKAHAVPEVAQSPLSFQLCLDFEADEMKEEK